VSYYTSITRDLLCKKCEENIVTDEARKKATKYGIKPQYCLKCLNRFGFNLEKEETNPTREAPIFPIPKVFFEDETTIARVGILLHCRDDQVRKLIREGLLKSRQVGKMRAVKKTSVLRLIDGVLTGQEEFRKVPLDISGQIVSYRKEILASYTNGALD
jgi:hypothetical protein